MYFLVPGLLPGVVVSGVFSAASICAAVRERSRMRPLPCVVKAKVGLMVRWDRWR